MRFAEIYEKRILTEAVDYMSLFTPLIKLVDQNELEDATLKKSIQLQISKTKKSLSNMQGNQQWVMYILKAYRSFLTRQFFVSYTTTNLPKNIEKLAYPPAFPKNFSLTARTIDHMITILQHYTTYSEYLPIKQYNPADKQFSEVHTELSELEEKYVEELGDDDRMLELEDGDEIINDFGDGYVWIMLNRGACRSEADAMGHCGNIPSQKSGDRVLSFRKKRDRAGKEFYEPYMTFIYNQESERLGEMKGRSNEKPHPKYHPYIVWLLKQDWIKGFGPRGYAPEEDFQITDLTKKQQENVANANPHFMLTNGIALSKIPEEVLESSPINLPKMPKHHVVSFLSKDKKQTLMFIDLKYLVEDHILKLVKDPFRYFDSRNIDVDDMNYALGYLDEDNMKRLYENYYKKIILEAGMTENDFMDFDEFSNNVSRDKFFDIFEEYLDADDEEIDFEEESTTFEELKNELVSMLYLLEESAYVDSTMRNVIKNLPDVDLGSVTFVSHGKFITYGQEITEYIGDDTEYAIYETDYYFDDEQEEEDMVYDVLSEIRKIEVDDRYIDTSYGKDDVNQAFSDYI